MQTYFGKVENGLLKIFGRKQFDQELKEFEGKNVEIIVKKKKSKRTNAQNAYYYVLVGYLAEEIGLPKEEVHQLIGLKFRLKKKHFINNELVELQGDFWVNVKTAELVEGTVKTIEYIESTTKLSTSEFAEMIDEMKVWSEEFFGIRLPNAGQNDLF